jgi:hypothetical protein
MLSPTFRIRENFNLIEPFKLRLDPANAGACETP